MTRAPSNFSWSNHVCNHTNNVEVNCAGCGENEGWGETFTLIGRDYFCARCKAEREAQFKDAAE